MRVSTMLGRAVLGTCGGLLLAGLAALPAQAAAPANDQITNATRLFKLPFRSAVDTSQATSVATDGDCVGGTSVWYRLRPGFTGPARATSIGSDYDTVVAVFRGSRDNRRLLACSDDFYDLTSVVGFDAERGRTYWIALSNCCSSGFDFGGRAVLNIYRQRPAGINAAVTRVESGAVSGRLYIDGTARCNTPSYAEVGLRVSQRLPSGAVARASTGVAIPDCGARGGTSSWSLSMDSETGWAFATGAAAVTMSTFAYDGFESLFDEEVSNVTVGTNPNRVTPRPSMRPLARPDLTKAVD